MFNTGITPIHQGQVLKEIYLEPLDISVTDFADNIGVARRTVSLIVNEHSGISAEMALRLSKAFNTTPELWLNMHQNMISGMPVKKGFTYGDKTSYCKDTYIYPNSEGRLYCY